VNSTVPELGPATDVHVPHRLPSLDDSPPTEPLPPACMDGTCGCPSAPDGADQHVWHQRGEYVDGLGWACQTCDTFGCAVVNAPTDACTQKGCGQPKAAHQPLGLCP
jgi:hypothetical protein